MAMNIYWYLIFFTYLIALVNCRKHKIYYNQEDLRNETTVKSLLVKVNYSSTSVEFQYREEDDAFKSWTIFYQKHIQIFKDIEVGEIDLGQPLFRFHCFIAFFDSSKIAPLKIIGDKLDQVPFNEIMELQSAFETRNWMLDYAIGKNRLGIFGGEVYDACKDADLILTNLEEAKIITEKLLLYSLTESLTPQSALPMQNYPWCDRSKNEIWQTKCRCQSNISIGWYPCTAKLCNSNEYTDDEDASLSSCGMTACRHKNNFVYLVDEARYCLSKTV